MSTPRWLYAWALGAYAAVSAVAGGIGSLLGGAVAEVSFLLAFAVAGSFVLLGALLVYRLRTLVDRPDAPPTANG